MTNHLPTPYVQYHLIFALPPQSGLHLFITPNPHSKLRFQNLSFISGIEALFPESILERKLEFWKRSFKFKLEY